MGSYVNKNLGPNESIIDEAKLHWIVFLKPVFFVMLAITAMILLSIHVDEAGPYIGGVLLIISIFPFLGKLIAYLCTEIALTNNRIVVKTGFIARTASDISLKKVEGIDVKQDILGRIFNYGSMSVRGTGSGLVWYRNVADPYRFQKALNNILGS